MTTAAVTHFLTIENHPETGAVKPYELWTNRIDGSRRARLSSFKSLAAAVKAYPHATVVGAA